MYTLIASGQTGDGNGPFNSPPAQPVQLWPVASIGDHLFIQNQSQRPLRVMVHLPLDGQGVAQPDLVIILPDYGDFIDHTVVDPTLAVSVSCDTQGATFAAFRTA